MEVKSPRNHKIFPYIILATVIVCAALILTHLWANVGGMIIPARPTGPTPTATLWWRTPQATESASPPALSANAPRGTPAPAGTAPESIDD
jgi:hypothetical protein